MPPEAKERYLEQEQQVIEYFADAIRAGSASSLFREHREMVLGRVRAES